MGTILITERGSTNGIQAKWIFVLAASVIGAAIMAAIGFVIFLTDSPLVRYRVVTVLLIFALSSISALLFATKVKVTGMLGGFTGTVIGPGALWLVSLLLFSKFYPEDKLVLPIRNDPVTLKHLAALADEAELKLGWNKYATWKESLNSFSILFKKSELNTLKNLMAATYYKEEEPKIEAPEITTVFVYFKDYTVKLQRIQGTKQNGTARVRFKSSASLPEGQSRSVLLVGEGKEPITIAQSYTDKDPDAGQGYAEINTPEVDCFIITDYKEDVPADGDYLIVDLKRFSTSGTGALTLGIITFEKSIKDFSLWTMKRSVLSGDGEIPLSFKLNYRKPQATLNRIQQDLKDWLASIDRALREVPNGRFKVSARDTLVQIQQTLATKQGKPLRFSDLVGGLPHKGSYAFYLENTQDVALATFLWE